MKWDEMTSKERDLLVAEKVMGWTNLHIVQGKTYWGRPDPHRGSTIVFPFTTDISAAWEVVQKMKAVSDYPYMFDLNESLEGKYWCEFKTDVYSYCDTAPEAICLAALRAVAVDV